MKPQDSRVWRRDGRRERRRDSEPGYYPPARRTRRQRAADLIAEAETITALSARARRNDLPGLVSGLPGVTTITISEDTT